MLELDERSNLEPLYQFLDAEPLDPKTYSVWVSVVSSSDHDGISLPEYILDLIRRTKCGVDFSFVASLGPDDEGDEADVQDLSHFMILVAFQVIQHLAIFRIRRLRSREG